MRTMDANFQLNLDSETVDRCDLAEPLCLTSTDTVGDAFRQMKDHNRGAVLVCDQQIVIGIFTERDVLKMMASGASFDVPLQQSMTPNPVVLCSRHRRQSHHPDGTGRLPTSADRGRARSTDGNSYGTGDHALLSRTLSRSDLQSSTRAPPFVPAARSA